MQIALQLLTELHWRWTGGCLCYVKEATELPRVHSLIDDAHAQASCSLDDQYFCSVDRPDS